MAFGLAMYFKTRWPFFLTLQACSKLPVCKPLAMRPQTVFATAPLK